MAARSGAELVTEQTADKIAQKDPRREVQDGKN
jgi:hypothetical protein